MAYTPLNRIKTNLYTPGGEYIFKTSQEGYAGPFHRYYDGRVFTGKSPNDQFIEELVPVNELENLNSPLEIQQASFPQDPDPLIDKEKWNSDLNRVYTILKTGNPTLIPSVKLPTPYSYTPSDQDYQIGEVTRYFTKKTNELKYVEVNRETYQNFYNQQSGYAWQFYLSFSLPWQITGDKQEVETTNRNIVSLVEKRLKIQGLPAFLKYDYLKFYKTA